MVQKGKKLERVVYEEKPHCGRCGAGIVGVIPKWRDGKPLCRECAFEIEQMNLQATGRIEDLEESKAPLTQEEKTRRIVLLSVLGVAVLFLFFRIYTLAPLLETPKPLRLGVSATDALTDKCIENLWRLSKNLQEGKLPNILPLCPASSRQYIVTEFADDTVISCPSPGAHGLEKLTVSLSSPIPHAFARSGE